MGVPPTYVLNLLDKIAADEGLSNVTKDFEAGSNHGDNFLGVMTSVIVRGQKNGQSAKLHLLCKLAPDNEHRRKAFQSALVFQRESFAYTDILPTFLEFQREKGVNDRNCFDSYPKCYAAIANEDSGEFVVIMGDLREQGFTMWPKKEPIRLDHALLTMEQLGRFHGISLALKQQQPDIFEKYTKLNDIFGPMFESPTLVTALEKAFERAENAVQDEPNLKILQNLKAQWREVFAECLDGRNTKFAIVTHGDAWNNNLLYKCNEQVVNSMRIIKTTFFINKILICIQNKAESIRVVDWQMCRYASPAIDLLYYLFTGTDKALRANEYQNLLKHYHGSLSDTVRALGSDPDQLFSFDDLQGELKRFGKFAFLGVPIMLRIILADPKDIRNYDDMKDTQEELNNKTNYNVLDANADAVYRERMNDIICDLVDYGYY